MYFRACFPSLALEYLTDERQSEPDDTWRCTKIPYVLYLGHNVLQLDTIDVRFDACQHDG